MKTVHCVLLTLLLATAVLAQGPALRWAEWYSVPSNPTGFARAVIEIEGGRLVATGWCRDYFDTHPDDHEKVFVICVDTSGQEIWSRVHEFPDQNAEAWTIQRTPDAGYVLAATANEPSAGASVSYLMKLDSLGEEEWRQGYGSPPAFYLPVIGGHTSDGGYFIASTLRVEDDNDFRLTRINADRSVRWTETYGGAGQQTLYAAVRMPDDGFLLVGTTHVSPQQGRDAYVVKVDSAGDSVWSHTYGGPADEIPSDLALMPDGGFVIVGGSEDQFVIRADSGGDTLWTRSLTHLPRLEVHSVAVTRDTGIVVAGSISRSSLLDSLAVLIKLDANGVEEWTSLLTAEYYGFGAYDVVQTEDAGFALAGKSHAAVEPSFCLALTYPDPTLPVEPGNVPSVPALYAMCAFPNPFNPTTTISFALPRAGRVTIAVFDLLGREVEMLTDATYPAGEHRISFDGSHLPSGLYFARLESGPFTATQKLLLLK